MNHDPSKLKHRWDVPACELSARHPYRTENRLTYDTDRYVGWEFLKVSFLRSCKFGTWAELKTTIFLGKMSSSAYVKSRDWRQAKYIS